MTPWCALKIALGREENRSKDWDNRIFCRVDRKFVSRVVQEPKTNKLWLLQVTTKGDCYSEREGRSALEQEKAMNFATELDLADDVVWGTSSSVSAESQRLISTVGSLVPWTWHLLLLCGQYICTLNLILSSFKDNMMISERIKIRLKIRWKIVKAFEVSFWKFHRKGCEPGIPHARGNSVAE